MAKRLRGPSIVTLTSDFGLQDPYVAEMKAAILRECPHAVLIDVTHQVSPQDVLGGSIMLQRTIAGFLPGTVHLAVVDPGVGSDRKILIVEIAGQTVVCPDNGLITWTWRRHGPGKARELKWRPKSFSPTFHGRDVMGPAAGMLAAGKSPSTLGTPMQKIVLLDVSPAPMGATSGRIIHIDRFGNAVSNVPFEAIDAAEVNVKIGRHAIGPVRKTYSDVAPGKPLALIGSSGLLEVAVRNGSAAATFNLRVGDPITIA